MFAFRTICEKAEIEIEKDQYLTSAEKLPGAIFQELINSTKEVFDLSLQAGAALSVGPREFQTYMNVFHRRYINSMFELPKLLREFYLKNQEKLEASLPQGNTFDICWAWINEDTEYHGSLDTHKVSEALSLLIFIMKNEES